MAKKLWGGRFAKKTAELMDEFNASIGFDQKMYRQDILGSTAHAKMLVMETVRILTARWHRSWRTSKPGISSSGRTWKTST